MPKPNDFLPSDPEVVAEFLEWRAPHKFPGEEDGRDHDVDPQFHYKTGDKAKLQTASDEWQPKQHPQPAFKSLSPGAIAMNYEDRSFYARALKDITALHKAFFPPQPKKPALKTPLPGKAQAKPVRKARTEDPLRSTVRKLGPLLGALASGAIQGAAQGAMSSAAGKADEGDGEAQKSESAKIAASPAGEFDNSMDNTRGGGTKTGVKTTAPMLKWDGSEVDPDPAKTQAATERIRKAMEADVKDYNDPAIRLAQDRKHLRRMTLAAEGRGA